jgi:hypothetical protein
MDEAKPASIAPVDITRSYYEQGHNAEECRKKKCYVEATRLRDALASCIAAIDEDILACNVNFGDPLT